MYKQQDTVGMSSEHDRSTPFHPLVDLQCSSSIWYARFSDKSIIEILYELRYTDIQGGAP
jgi:hypothetical protein